MNAVANQRMDHPSYAHQNGDREHHADDLNGNRKGGTGAVHALQHGSPSESVQAGMDHFVKAIGHLILMKVNPEAALDLAHKD